MIKEVSSKHIKWGIAAATALFSIFIFYLNTIYPYFPGDDLIFMLKIPEDGIIGTERVASLSDLLESQYNFYFNYHYRVLNHTILQALLALPPVVFDILNVYVFLLLPVVVLQVSSLKKDLAYWEKYFIILMFIWVFHINLGWAYFPATGALNYTWMLIPQLWYLTELLKYDQGTSVNKKLILFLALVNSLGNENACVMLWTLTAVVALLNRDKDNRFLWWSFGIYMTGGAFMLLSPSVGKRLETQGHMSGGLYIHLKEFTRRTIYYLIRYTPVLLFLVFSRSKTALSNRKHLLLLLALAAATFSMVLAPLFEPRSAVLGFFIAMILSVSMASGEWKRWPLYALSIIGLLTCFYRLPYFQQQYERHQVNERILEANRGSQERVYLERYCDNATHDFLLCHENSDDPHGLDNSSTAAFHNIKEVVLSDMYVQSERRKLLFDTLSKNINHLSNFKSQSFENNLAVYFRETKEGMDLIVQAQVKEDPFYILRGSPGGFNKNRFFDLIPETTRLYFLDYLEDTSKRQQEVLEVAGYKHNYFYISDPSRYKYLLVSPYSFSAHAPYGGLIKLHLNEKG